MLYKITDSACMGNDDIEQMYIKERLMTCLTGWAPGSGQGSE